MTSEERIKGIEDHLRQSIQQIKLELSPFCLDGCNSTCCDFTGTDITGIRVTKKELKAMVKNPFKRRRLGFEQLIVCEWKERGIYRLQHTVCPSYDSKTKKCLIHDNTNRPAACSVFPISLELGKNGDTPEVNMVSSCQYIRQNWHPIVDNWESENKCLYDKVDIKMRAFFGAIYGHDNRHIKETNKQEIHRLIRELRNYHEYDD